VGAVDWSQVITAAVAAAVIALPTAAAVYGALRVELKYLRRDVDHAHRRQDDHENNYIHQRG
jgi:hypothetical protein